MEAESSKPGSARRTSSLACCYNHMYIISYPVAQCQAHRRPKSGCAVAVGRGSNPAVASGYRKRWGIEQRKCRANLLLQTGNSTDLEVRGTCQLDWWGRKRPAAAAGLC